MVTDGAAKHRIGSFQRIQCLADGGLSFDCDLHLVTMDAGKIPQMRRQLDPDGNCAHASVCTSTERTGGRSRTIAVQLSPASAEAYTWPPLVPKYTPHESSLSTAIASRRTLT